MQTLFLDFDETDKRALKLIAYLRHHQMNFRVEPDSVLLNVPEWDENLTLEEFLKEFEQTEP